MSKYTISLLGVLLVLICTENVWAQVYVGGTNFTVPEDLSKYATLDFQPRSQSLPKMQLQFDDHTSKYITASFYGDSEKADSLFQNNLSLKARYYANINEKFRAVAQFRCSNFCDNIALSITILGRGTNKVFEHREVILARIQ